MRTDRLIATLAADAKPAMAPRRALLYAILAGACAAALLFFAVLGPRPDFMHALSTIRFDFKFVLTVSLGLSALAVTLHLARPEAKGGAAILLLVPAMLAVALVLELVNIPAQEWAARWIGHNARACMVNIPMLALVPLVLILLALRQAAPARPALSGAVAGLLAAGLGASFYAAHCPDDSPLFVATWYTIAIGLVSALGAFLGPRLLRW